MSLNSHDSNDPTNFNIKVNGTILQNSIAVLQNSMYEYNGGSYTVLNLQHTLGINMAVTSFVNHIFKNMIINGYIIRCYNKYFSSCS